jgi:hypothetical protein
MDSRIRFGRVIGWTIVATMVAAFTLLITVGASGSAGHRGIVCATGPPPTSPPPVAGHARIRGSTCADMRMTLSHQPGRVEIGRPFKAKMVVDNLGPTTAFQVHAKDNPPSSFTFTSVTAPAGVSCATPAVGTTGTVDCSVASMPSGASITIVVMWRPTATGSQANQAQVQTLGSFDPNSANDNRNDPINVETNTRGCTLVGTAGADDMTGTAGNDVICGLGGADHIDGAAGDDKIYGLRGADVLTDHNGTDKLIGGQGADTLDTADGAGGDTANGGTGTNTCTTDAQDTALNCS